MAFRILALWLCPSNINFLASLSICSIRQEDIVRLSESTTSCRINCVSMWSLMIVDKWLPSGQEMLDWHQNVDTWCQLTINNRSKWGWRWMFLWCQHSSSNFHQLLASNWCYTLTSFWPYSLMYISCPNWFMCMK